MPSPKKGESQKDYIARCIPTVINEGTTKDNKQAAAICFSMWKKHHKDAKASPELESFGESLRDYLAEAKKEKDKKNKDKEEDKNKKKEKEEENKDEKENDEDDKK